MYMKYTPLRYSKIAIFATACRFLIQALRSLPERYVHARRKA
ncbi:Hypothetical protein OINT_1002075 [Brucella intermedia LMG 3301]|uniref:Uncharacterized protein n=2 Tax=Brucella intermedia TaxID=94625 RepID=U4VE28_9HYPH|nr:Hypothetical protein OINT_1002075 [Brucella intermedia LMG 3301]ERM01097.1 hypothetical protein Q644_23515 [Brucella intermedia 229E]